MAMPAAEIEALIRAGLPDAEVTITCRPEPTNCLSPGSVITAVVRHQVVLPLVPSALGDQAHLDTYRAAVRASKARVYAFCDRLGLAYVPSEANFVLVRVGPRAGAIVEALRQRRIFVRDRSGEPGCAGCIRITAGIVAHTDACLSALEEILCAVA